MSLKKKIIFGFLTSSIIIVVLMVFAYASFIETRRETHYLELSYITYMSGQTKLITGKFLLFRL